MNTSTAAAAPGIEVARAMGHELETLASAIAMVASGASDRVSVASLRFAAELVEPARRIAAAAGVRVTPLWTIDERDAGLAIERLDPE